MSNAIEINSLSVKFNKKVILENINLTIKENSITAIIGPNGSGKTTFIRAILGLQPTNSGHVKIFNYISPDYPKGLIGYLPQKNIYNLKFPSKVIDIVVMGRYPQIGFLKLPSKKDIEIAEKCLNRVGIITHKNEYFQDLSAGLKQRVLIARALAVEPKLLIFDEPSTGLDIISQQEFYNLLIELKQEGFTIVVVTHDIGIISKYVDSIVGLNKKIHFYGTPEDSMTQQNLENIFGKGFTFIIHDKNCETCKYGNTSL